jgi:hypothetical protein
MHRRALLSLTLLAAACGPKPLPAPPPAPRVSVPGELIPSDLDVVVRLDLGRVKAALGAATISALAGDVLARGSVKQAADELLIASLLEADLVYLGYRPSPLGAPLDRVLALQGRFTAPPIWAQTCVTGTPRTRPRAKAWRAFTLSATACARSSPRQSSTRWSDN